MDWAEEKVHEIWRAEENAGKTYYTEFKPDIVKALRDARNKGLEEAARKIQPLEQEPPCDCWAEGCTCGNSDDAQSVAQWHEQWAGARCIRALKTEDE